MLRAVIGGFHLADPEPPEVTTAKYVFDFLTPSTATRYLTNWLHRNNTRPVYKSGYSKEGS